MSATMEAKQNAKHAALLAGARDELVAIKEQMEELLESARQRIRWASQVPGCQTLASRAKAYWLGHIETALNNDSSYLGRSMVTLEDTIDELQALAQDYDTEADDDEGDGEGE